MRKTTRWASDSHGATRDWIEFVIQDDKELKRYRVDVSFMLSTYRCIFGEGCPSVMMRGATSDGGCCQLGVMMNEGDRDRVQDAIDEMEPGDADNYEILKNGSWYRKHNDDEYSDEYPYHTRTRDGLCIMSNRAGGPTGKPGCSLHALASRKGVNHSETKPDICWQIPISMSVTEDDGTEGTLIVLTATPGHTWGSMFSRNTKHIGYWCTETADAYDAGSRFVYKSNEIELRKMIGDKAYEQMVIILEEIQKEGGRRTPMPGEHYMGGQPMIPLLVVDRLERWTAEGDRRNIERSQAWMKENGPEALYEPFMEGAAE